MRPVSKVIRDEVDAIVLQSKTTVHYIYQDVITNGENGGPPLHTPDWQHNRKRSRKTPSSSPHWLYDFHMNAASMTAANIQTFLDTPDTKEAVDILA